MLRARLAPVSEWEALLRRLDVPLEGRVLVAGPPAESLAARPAVPVVASTTGLTLFGPPLEGPIPDGATAEATLLPTGAFDAVLALSAWSRPDRVGAVAGEALRLTRPGGTIVLGDLDAVVLVAGPPAAYRAAVLYARHPDLARRLVAAHEHTVMLGVELLRGGVHPVTVERMDLPMAFLDGPEAYASAVRAGLWPGFVDLSPEERDEVLAALADSLRPPVRFPIVDRQPWVIARGRRPT